MVAHVVDLEGGVGDAVLVSEELFEFAPAGVAVFVLADEDVGGEGREARGDGPDVEVWTLTMPSAAAILRPTSSAFRPRGVASSRMLVESLRSFQELPRIRNPMATLTRGSA